MYRLNYITLEYHLFRIFFYLSVLRTGRIFRSVDSWTKGRRRKKNSYHEVYLLISRFVNHSKRSGFYSKILLFLSNLSKVES